MRLLAIDPGTKFTGLALFVDGQLEEVGLIESQRGHILTRINHIMGQLELYRRTWEPTDVACETWGGERNPGLRTFIQGIKSTCDEIKLPWHGCHQSSVMSSVRLEGYPARTSEQRKAAIVAGVKGLYPEMMLSETVQDIFDAVAVGHYYLGQLRTAEIQARAIC